MIDDHEHEWTMLGPFRGKDCARCGERVNKHLSYGRALAETLGGDPVDYLSI